MQTRKCHTDADANRIRTKNNMMSPSPSVGDIISASVFVPIPAKTDAFKNFFFVSTIYDWNKLSKSDVNCDSVETFQTVSLPKRLRICSVISVNYHYITVLCPFNLLINFKCYNTV